MIRLILTHLLSGVIDLHGTDLARSSLHHIGLYGVAIAQPV